MNNKTYFLYSLLIFSALTFLFFMISGCSKAEIVEIDPYPDMPRDLRQMQGRWESAGTNNTETGDAIIEGYTIRVRLQAQANLPALKQNASITRLDEQRKLLIINGGSGAWPYIYGQANGQEQLELEFFSNKEWHRLQLKRKKAQATHSG